MPEEEPAAVDGTGGGCSGTALSGLGCIVGRTGFSSVAAAEATAALANTAAASSSCFGGKVSVPSSCNIGSKRTLSNERLMIRYDQRLGSDTVRCCHVAITVQCIQRCAEVLG